MLESFGCELWITAAGGTTPRHTAIALDMIERQARADGFKVLKFQTVRRGLIRLAQKCGYTVTGYVCTKNL